MSRGLTSGIEGYGRNDTVRTSLSLLIGAAVVSNLFLDIERLLQCTSSCSKNCEADRDGFHLHVDEF